ncbi:hypothetical protein JCM10908_001098 [Rhodotorula pacifica]|uniref:uncharacterized protein n=1 Tax=Rhodotorula pacifica TaxID=1495444 RepID=UPI0031729D15
MIADPLALLATVCCPSATLQEVYCQETPPRRVSPPLPQLFTKTCPNSQLDQQYSSSSSLSSAEHLSSMATGQGAVRLPPCASLYAASGCDRARLAPTVAKSEVGGGQSPRQLNARDEAPAASTSPNMVSGASLAHYALAPVGSLSAQHVAEDRTDPAVGGPSHPSAHLLALATSANPPLPAQSHQHSDRTTLHSPRPRQRSVPDVAAMMLYPHRFFPNVLCDSPSPPTSRGDPGAPSQGSHPIHGTSGTAGGAVASVPIAAQAPSARRRTSTPLAPAPDQVPRLSPSAAADSATRRMIQCKGPGPERGASPPPSLDVSASRPGATTSASQSASEAPLGESKPDLERAISASLSAQDELADDGGAASGSQGEGPSGGDRSSGGSTGSKARKELKGSKRAEQNRAAQRAFRERKEQKLRSLQELVSRIPEFEDKLASLSSHCSALEADRAAFLSERQSFANERASWDRERRCLLGEIDALRRVLHAEKAQMPAMMVDATPVGPLSPRSGSGGHSAEATPSPRSASRALCYAPVTSRGVVETIYPDAIVAWPTADPKARPEVKREAPDDFHTSHEAKRAHLTL